jgi:hypothetical protein
MSATITQSSAPSALSGQAHSSRAQSSVSPEVSPDESSIVSMQTPSHAAVTSSTSANALLNQRSLKNASGGAVTGERAYLRNLTEARLVHRVELIAVAVLLLFVVMGLATMLMDQR